MSFKELWIEIKEKNKSDALTKKQLIVLEQSYFTSLLKNGICPKCGRKENLTLDHIIPLDILKQFGIDTEREFVPDNLRLLCKPCNMFKSRQLDFSTPITKELLIKFLEKI